MQSEKGFSLIEMMITLAISAIIIGAAFGSYTIISRNFEWQKDMKYISQSARNVIEMIQKDIRNAGFRFEANAAITDPVKIYDAGDCCDRIEIIYDETINKRVKIEYRLQQYSSDNSRFRLYKKKTNLSNNNTVEFDTPIADYIEALKFTGSRGNCTDGDVKKGCGIEQLVTPSSARYVTLYGRNNNTCSDDILKIFDGDPTTFWYFRLPFGGAVIVGGLTLMLVVLPIVIVSAREALRAVPSSLREAALAAGATRWQMIRKITLPAALPGIMTGSILAISRAIGEAAPLLVVSGVLFIRFAPEHLMDQFTAMPLQIYNWAGRPQEEFHAVAATGIIVLLFLLLAFNTLAIVVRQVFQKPLS